MNKRMHGGKNGWIACGLALLLILASGCTTGVEKPDSVPWHTVYRPINDPEAIDFLHKGIDLLTETHGAPKIRVNKVLLRQTAKTEASAHYRAATDFSKMELVDRERGIFCIYLATAPDHERFYYLLGHEIGHLLRPEIVGSAAEERFCNEFSRLLCAQENRPWSAKWETRDWVTAGTDAP